MKRRILLAPALFALAACVHNSQYARPASPAALTTTADMDSAFIASLQAVSEANLPVASKDRASGTITTQWQETFTKYAASSPPTRRIQFQITVDGGMVTVLPKPQNCEAPGSCQAADDLTVPEAALADKLIGSIESHLSAIPGSRVSRADVTLQAGREPQTIYVNPQQPQAPPQVSVQVQAAPSQPAQPQPIFIRTARAGLQEVAPGRDVEVEMVHGNRMSGKIVEASPQSITLDLGIGQNVVIRAEDIAQILAP